MVVLRDFHCFTALPDNIQYKIWKYASFPHGPIYLHPCVTYHYSFQLSSPEMRLRSFLENTSPTRMRNYILVDKKQHRATARARRDLMSACRESRRVVIEVWVGIVAELCKDAGPETDFELPDLLGGLIFKRRDLVEEGRTFYIFAKLPTELQVQIWKLAALPGGQIGLREDVLLPDINQWNHLNSNPGWSPRRLSCSERLVRFMLRTEKRKIHRWLSDGTYRGAYAAAGAKNSLLHTCRLSRKVAVETWKRIVEIIPETLECNFDRQNIITQLNRLLVEKTSKITKVIGERGGFERFSALPLTIRTNIWKYASLPEGDFTFTPELFKYLDTVRHTSNRRYIRFLDQTSPRKIHKWVNAEESHLYNWKAVEARKATTASKVLQSMMRTNREARKMALNTWSCILYDSKPTHPLSFQDRKELPHPHSYWGWKSADEEIRIAMRRIYK